ncbi:MAG: CoA transferase [Gemmobacter sp.]|nr:CoA transferase [Gemmobacter sp.]
MGTQLLHAMAHRNPAFCLAGPEETHNAAIIASLSRFHAINSALEVDLTGQVGSEQVRGQVDYVRAAQQSPGGRAIIALPSITPKGVSRIVPRVDVVTCARADADTIVTEHGVAKLRGQPLTERAPDDRHCVAGPPGGSDPGVGRTKRGPGMTKGPLAGLRFAEIVGIGPGPFAAMVLADLGADVVRIDRIQPSGLGIDRLMDCDFAARGRASVAVDLKHPDCAQLVLDLNAQADALIESFRPGVMERLGLGPAQCLARNPQLAYGRLTGWGQTGTLVPTAGHDITDLALTGVLGAIGRADGPPVPPLNLLGDYAGGSLLMVIGLLAATFAARQTGQGQVVDAAIVDAVSLLAAPLLGLIAAGLHGGGRGGNLLDSGAPHYDSYICAFGGYLAIGPIEAKFRDELLRGLGFDPAGFPDVTDRANWPAARRLLADRIASRSRDDWEALFHKAMPAWPLS